MIRALKRRLAVPVTAFVAAVAVGTSGCTGEDGADGTGGGAARDPGGFVVGVREPASLLPGQVNDAAGRMIAGALWTPLVTYDTTRQEIVPLAAASVFTTDQVVWTVQLRPGQRFHDGSPLTAGSYVGAWRAALAQRWPGADVLTEVLRAKDMRVVDPVTFELVLERPFAKAPLVLGSPALLPLPQSLLDSGDWADFATHPVGNGPYRLAERWRAGSGGRLVRFEEYAGVTPGTAREIELRVLPDARTQYEQVRAGTIDLATAVPGAAHDVLHSELADRNLTWPMPELTYLTFPLADNRFSDAAVRHAFAMAVDRAAMEAGVLDRQVDPARSLLPPIVALPQRSGPCRPCNHDPSAAKSLLQQAIEPLGPVTVYHHAEHEPWIAELAGQLRAALGLEVATERIGEGAAPAGPLVVTRRLFSPSPNEPLVGIPGYAGSGFAELLAGADAATDPQDSAQLYRVAENQVLRDLPIAPLWSAHGHAVWTERLRQVRQDPFSDLALGAIEARG